VLFLTALLGERTGRRRALARTLTLVVLLIGCLGSAMGLHLSGQAAMRAEEATRMTLWISGCSIAVLPTVLASGIALICVTLDAALTWRGRATA
jgi:hypothetical protein